MKILLTILMGILFTNIVLAEEIFSPFKSEEANKEAQKFKDTYDQLRERLNKSLETSRAFSAKQGDIEEIKKIQAVLDGDFSQELKSSIAKTALKSFKSNFQRLCGDYASKLKIVLKAQLADGNIKASEELDTIIKKLEDNSKIKNYAPETFRVEAEKNWQVSDIEVKKGDKVTFYCTGTWTAYKKQQKQDADTNKLAFKIGDSILRKSGKKSEFIAEKSGKLSFCMDPRLKGKRRSPYGTLSVKVTRTPLDSFQKLYDLALNLNTQNNNTTQGKRKNNKKKISTIPLPPDTNNVGIEEKKPKKLTKHERKLLKKLRKQEKENSK